MPEYLTKRDGRWHFARRVPLEFASLDTRGVVRHSTKVAVATDRRGNRAGKVADVMNRELEAYWRGLTEGKAQEAQDRYVEARRRARAMGFDYVEAQELATRPLEELVSRYEKLAGVVHDPGARGAVLGFEQRPVIKLSEVFPKFEHQMRTEVADMSENQLRRWKNVHKLAISDFIAQVGDKDLVAVSHADVLDYVDWLEDRVGDGEIAAKTANKYIGHNSKMTKALNRKLRLGLSDLFSGVRLKAGVYVQRPPFDASFVQNAMLAEGALMGLNEEARRAVMLIADTGLRLSEAVNLNEATIHLDCGIPYVEVKPDGRRVKTQDSIRQVPLVGVALAAMKLHPQGFPRYHDKGASFSAYVNAYLSDHKLRPTPKHSVYSFRHTFEDRLKATKAQDSMIDELMGHADGKGYKYGSGHPLALKAEVLQAIAFKAPVVL